MPPTPRPVIERIVAKLEVNDNGCWLFQGVTVYGYGRISKPPSLSALVHREVYEHYVGPIPAGLDLDHVCHNEALARGECEGGLSCPHRACCNPDHLRPATRAENVHGGSKAGHGSFQRAKTHCPQGHEYAGHNVTYKTPKRGGVTRSCKECARVYAEERRRAS